MQAAVLSLICLLIVVMDGVGCGHPEKKAPPTLVSVSGRITIDDRPLTKCIVLLLPVTEGNQARGVTNDKGEFRLLDESGTVGVSLGDYRVIFKSLDISGSRASQQLDAAYQDPKSTPVRATITTETEQINLRLSGAASSYKSAL